MMRLACSTAVRAGVAWCAVGRLAGAQLPGVAVDPHILVLTPQRPAGEITVFNPRPQAAEFSLDLRFGYVTTDSSGAPRVELKDGPDSTSAADWVTPYPRRFTLAPGAAQLVRLLVRPPSGVADGEYWARLTVHSHQATREGAPDGPEIGRSTTGTTSGGLTLEMATVMPVFFRKGIVATGLAIDRLDATARGGLIEVRSQLHRTGNSAFIGVGRVAVLDSLGRELATNQRQVAVYMAAAPRWEIALSPALIGAARSVKVSFSTERHDVPRRLVLQAPTVGRQVPISSPFGSIASPPRIE